MIINAITDKGNEVDVEVCNRKYIAELYNIYRWVIGVPQARLRSGYWRDANSNEIVRLATSEEIDHVEAFRVITKVVEEL